MDESVYILSPELPTSPAVLKSCDYCSGNYWTGNVHACVGWGWGVGRGDGGGEPSVRAFLVFFVVVFF